MTEIFNTREIAMATMTVIVLSYAMTKQTFRSATMRLVSIFFTPKILGTIVLAAAYLSMVILSTHLAGFWHLGLLKDTLVWFCLSAIAPMLRLGSTLSGRIDLASILSDTLQVVIVLQFLVNTYTFHIAVELVLVPLTLLLAIVSALPVKEPRHVQANRVLSGINHLVSVVIVVIAITKAVLDFRAIASVDSIRNLLLAPILTLSYVPFLYVFVLVARYESLFIRVRFALRHNHHLVRYAQVRCVLKCRASMRRIDRLSAQTAMLFLSTSDRRSVRRWLSS